MKFRKVNNLNRLQMLIFFFSVLLLFNAQSWAKELIVGFGQNKAPFVIGMTKQGLEIDIFREALAHKGHSMKVYHMPNKRLQIALISMKNVDAVATVREVPNDGLYYVDEFMYFDNYAISKMKNNLKISQVSDLKGLSILAWQNAYRDLGSEFELLFKPEPYKQNKKDYKPEPSKQYKKVYREDVNQNSQNKLFWLDRAQVIIIDKTIFNWYRIQLSKELDTNSEVIYHSIFQGKTYFQAAFKNKELVKDFEEGLKYIKNTGRYNQLYYKYTKQR